MSRVMPAADATRHYYAHAISMFVTFIIDVMLSARR